MYIYRHICIDKQIPTFNVLLRCRRKTHDLLKIKFISVLSSFINVNIISNYKQKSK